MTKKVIVVPILFIGLLAIIVFAVLFNRSVVADYANGDDFTIGPIVYNDNLYFVSGAQGDKSKEQKLGYILDKSNLMEVALPMFFANQLNSSDGSDNHLRVEHDMVNSYSNSLEHENKEYTNMIFNKYSDFELLFSNNGEASLTSCNISKDLVTSLEEQFGNIDYNIADFNESDKNHYIYVKSPYRDPYNLKDDSYLYVGVIMKKDNNFFYGNLNNRIRDDEAGILETALGSQQ